MMAASNKDEAISKQLTQQIEDLSINTDDLLTAICANCDKEVVNPNTCNKCKTATYCNASCKKKHRHKHKQDCIKRVAELREEVLQRKKRADELHDIELFKQPPPNEDCPICMLSLPELESGSKYNSCCGKILCSGCVHAVEKREDDQGLCPFCRTPRPSSAENMKRLLKRVELNDAKAIYNMGCNYYHAAHGLPHDYERALELWHRAAELGDAAAYYNIGCVYDHGNGARRDEDKAKHYYELAAMRGDMRARLNLGALEGRAGNYDRALKHFMVGAGGGHKNSLTAIQEMFKNGGATKDDYTQAIRAYQTFLGEIKSPQRDEAAAFDEACKYY